MSSEMSRMRKPITRDGAGAAAEFTIDADVGKPTATDDPNVYPIPGVGNSDPDFETEEQWQIKTRVSGTGAAAALIDYRVWIYDVWIGVWHSSVWLKAPGDDAVTDALGQIQDLPGVMGGTFVGIEVDGLTGDLEVHFEHTRR